MAHDVVVPEVGELGMEVTLVRWLKQPGDSVAVGDVLFELDTDKAVLEVEAYAAGTLAEVTAAAGDTVVPRQVVARLLEPGETADQTGEAGVSDAPPASAPGTPPGGVTSSSPPAAPGATTARPSASGASPRARRLARELGVDIGAVAGTGAGGMVTERDVYAAAGLDPSGAAEETER
jgi:pyruvate dehydrogenase E2 component (dihydrolipoamide acetyltransferase)